MQVIVTGGAGFIGSNLVAACLSEGHRVVVLDSLQRRGTERNLRWLLSRPGAERLTFVRGDVRDQALVRRLVGASDVDAVFHLAAQVAVTTSIEQPRNDLEVNLCGTFNVLEAARRSRAARPPVVVYTSTNKVYGALERYEVVETPSRYRFADSALDARGIAEDEPLDFHSPYGCSKGAADQYVRDYGRIYGLPTVVFRMSCVYGPRQFGNEDQGWVAHFLIAAATGAPLTIYGTGKQVRDVLHVDDLVQAFKLAVERIDRTAGRVYNIGGGPANSIAIWRELGPRLEELSGRELTPLRGDARPGDQLLYVTDTSAAWRDFGWRPQVSLDEGLGRLWTWIRNERALFRGTVNGSGAGQPAAPSLTIESPLAAGKSA